MFETLKFTFFHFRYSDVRWILAERSVIWMLESIYPFILISEDQNVFTHYPLSMVLNVVSTSFITKCSNCLWLRFAVKNECRTKRPIQCQKDEKLCALRRRCIWTTSESANPRTNLYVLFSLWRKQNNINVLFVWLNERKNRIVFVFVVPVCDYDSLVRNKLVFSGARELAFWFRWRWCWLIACVRRLFQKK